MVDDYVTQAQMSKSFQVIEFRFTPSILQVSQAGTVRTILEHSKMLDFLLKLVIIKHRIVSCNEHPASDALDLTSFFYPYSTYVKI